MGELKLAAGQLGPIDTNTYIIYDEEHGDAMVIDPAGSPDVIIDFLNKHEFKMDGVMLTHGHHDHIGALEALRDHYGMYLHVFAAKPEQEVLMVADYNLSKMFGNPYTTHANMMCEDKMEFEVMFKHKVICYHTPGHTIGSCCYYFPKEGWLFSGDTLFAGSVGRTDFPTGNTEQILHSVNHVLMKLPDSTIVYPGHGPQTTIGDERRTNPYVERDN